MKFAPTCRVMLFCFAAMLAACQTHDGEGQNCAQPDPCAPHGQCVDGLCRCDAGWQPSADGLSCVAFDIDLCEGLDCSGLGECLIIQQPPYGIPKAECQCAPGAWPTEDGLDCVEPCAGFDCAPGDCLIDDQGQAGCDCPLGYEAGEDGRSCVEQENFHFELVYEAEGQQASFGQAWIREWETETGTLIEATTRYAIPVSWEGTVGGLIRSSAKLDPQGRLLDFVQDQQLEFIHFTARRRLSYTLEESAESGGWQMRFDFNVLDRLWHGELPMAGIPLPMAEGYEFPSFSYNCFDAFFYFMLGRALDFSQPPESILVVYPAFVLSNEIPLQLSGDEVQGQIHLPSHGVEAHYESGLLAQVDYDWVRWLPSSGASSLEFNMQPLPNTPLDHRLPELPAFQEEAVEIAAADGSLLRGALALPAEGPISTTALFFVPDLFADSRDHGTLLNHTQRDLAIHFAAAGYANLRMDDRGVGASEGESTADLATLQGDLLAAFDFLLADERFERAVLVSKGLGAPHALELQSLRGPLDMILLSPAGSDLAADLYHTIVDAMLLSGFREDEAERNLQGFREWLVGFIDGSQQEEYRGRSPAWWQARLTSDLLDSEGLEPARVLLARGAEDMVSSSEGMDRLEQELGSTGWQVQRLDWPDCSHALTYGRRSQLWERVRLPMPILDQVLEDLIAWLDELDAGRKGAAR